MLDSSASSPEILGVPCQSSDRFSMGKPVARDVLDVNENVVSSPQLWHQKENTRFQHWQTSCEKRQTDSMKQRLIHHNVQNVQCQRSRESLFECTTDIESS